MVFKQKKRGMRQLKDILKNNIVVIILLIIIGLLLWRNFSPVKEDKIIKKSEIKIEENNTKINSIKTLEKEYINNIDRELNPAEKFKIQNQIDEKIINNNNNTDSVQFYDWARSAYKSRSIKSIRK